MSGITDPTEEYFKDGLWGWDGTQWRKAGLPLWYGGQIVQQIVNINAAAGYAELAGNTVPAGEIWVIQVAGAVDINSALSRVLIYCLADEIPVTLAEEYSVSANHWVIVYPQIVIAPGDHLVALFYGCTAGDDIYFRYAGYKVKLA